MDAAPETPAQNLGGRTDAVSRYCVASAARASARLGDAMVFELDASGLIRRVRPHLRPWLGMTLFAIVLGPKVARHPGVIWRALRSR